MSISLKEGIELYLYKSNLAKGTKAYLKRSLHSFLAYLGNKPICKITQLDIINYQAHLKEKGKSLHTIYQEVQAIRWLLRFLNLKCDIDCLDYRKVEIKKPYSKSWSQCSDENIKKMLTLVNTKTLVGMRNYALIQTLYSTGCRSHELVQMKRSQVDWINGWINIIGKGNKPRTVYLTKVCMKALQKYLSMRDDSCDALFASTPHPHYKSHEVIRPLGISSVRMLFFDLTHKLGFKVHAHQLRKSFATKIYNDSHDIRRTQVLLGHSSIATTEKYTLVEDNLKEFHNRHMEKNRKFQLKETKNGQIAIEVEVFVADNYDIKKANKILNKAVKEIIK